MKKKNIIKRTVLAILILTTIITLYQKYFSDKGNIIAALPLDGENIVVLRNRGKANKLIIKKHNTKNNKQWEITLDNYLERAYFYELYDIAKNSIIIKADQIILPVTQEDDEYNLSRKIVSINSENGNINWETPIPLGKTYKLFFNIADKDQLFVYIINALAGPRIYALDLKSGKTNWKSEKILLINPFLPSLSNKYLLLNSREYRNICLIDKKNGNQISVKSDSLGILYNNKCIYLEKVQNAHLVKSLNLKTLQTETIYKINDKIGTYNGYGKFFIYKNNLIYFSENSRLLKSVSLIDKKITWKIKISYNFVLNNRADIFGHSDENVIPAENLYYYLVNTRFFILVLNKEREKKKKISLINKNIIIDLKEGKIIRDNIDFTYNSFYITDIFVKNGLYFITISYKSNLNPGGEDNGLVIFDGKTNEFKNGYNILYKKRKKYSYNKKEYYTIFPDSYYYKITPFHIFKNNITAYHYNNPYIFNPEKGKIIYREKNVYTKYIVKKIPIIKVGVQK